MLCNFVYDEERYSNYGYEDEAWEETEYYGVYVSDYGRVYNARTGHFLKPKPMDKHGHLGVALRINGRDKYVYVHRLIAKAFIPNPEGYPIVRHLNDDPSYNEVDNLAWGTQRDNHLDCIRNGHFKPLSDEAREKSLLASRKPVIVTEIESGRQFIYKSLNDAV